MLSSLGIALVVFLLALAGCNNKRDSGEVLAKVGSSVLTKEEMLIRNPEYRATEVETG